MPPPNFSGKIPPWVLFVLVFSQPIREDPARSFRRNLQIKLTSWMSYNACALLTHVSHSYKHLLFHPRKKIKGVTWSKSRWETGKEYKRGGGGEAQEGRKFELTCLGSPFPPHLSFLSFCPRVACGSAYIICKVKLSTDRPSFTNFFNILFL